MFRNVFMKTLWEQRRSLVWWSLGIAALLIVTTLFYPSFVEAGDLSKMFEDSEALANLFAGGFTDLTSPEGFLNSQIFALTIPIVFAIFAISAGSGAIAGEEERGTLDLLMSSPVTRSGVLVHKLLALILAISELGTVVWISTVVGISIVDMDLDLWRLAQTVLSGVLLGIAFGSCALALGSATGRRGLSIAVSSALAIVSYFLNALSPMVDALEPLTKLSLFYYYLDADPLTNGLDLVHAAVLIGVSVVLVAVALFTFERRDLAV